MSNRKRIFFTSDWHLFHANVIKFSNRPFRDVEHMNESLIRNYNAIMTDNSLCYFLGDMGMSGSKEINETISRLKGTKVLVLGNHDKKHNSMYNCGFDVVLNAAKLIVANEELTMSHCPLIGLYRENVEGMKGSSNGENWHGEHRANILNYAIHNRGQFHLHGHIHSPNGGKSTKILGRQYDVGVDANNYRPVSLSEIESWIVKTKELENDTSKS